MLRDAETMRYWSSLPHESRDQTAAWLDSMIAADPATSDDFIVEHDGVAIGKMGAWRLPEIGFLLARSHWRRGFAGEALAAFVAYARQRGIARLTADVDPGNIASRALLSAAGFRETGRATATYRLGDRICDSIYLARDLA